MAIQIKHPFVSAKGDGTDATLVRPSNWNANHTTSMATLNLIGRLTAGTGSFEEIPVTAFVAAALNSADGAAFLAALGLGAFSTGDAKPTLKTTADTGWVIMDDGSIGTSGSGATTRANADCLNLFTLLFNNLSDAAAPLLTSTGAATSRAAQGSAAAAWAALCRMSLPKQLGRSLVGAGAGSGLTSRPLGSSFGEETHTLTTAEIPSHTHANSISDPGHHHGGGAGGGVVVSSVSSGTTVVVSANTSDATTGVSITNVAAGGGGAHNNTQASAAWNVMVKL